MIMANPEETTFNGGIKKKAQLIAQAIKTVGRTPFVLIDGGTIMAINIAYKAIPSASETIAGKKLLASAPKSVPVVQPT